MKFRKLTILLICALLPFLFTGCENKNKNTLSTPTNISINNGVIIFDAVNNAEYYTICINDAEFTVDSRYSNDVSIKDNQINYNANKILTLGESYSIKIKASASEMNDSPYSNTVSYKHIPTINKPTTIKLNGTVLTWDIVNNASYYSIKVVTPYTSTLYDKEGNVLNGDDSATIEKAELTEYTFSTNQFDFGSLLTKAGNYNFYINAVHTDGKIYTESGYTSKTTYKHTSKLETPSIGSAYTFGTDLYINAVIDSNANKINITCNNETLTATLNSEVNPYVQLNSNVVTLNLSQLFPKINFNEAKQYLIKVQACYTSASAINKFYFDSDISSVSIYEKTIQLETPSNLTISENPNQDCEELKWSYNNHHAPNLSGFKIYVFNGTDIITYNINKETTSMLLPADCKSVAVQALGSGNYLNSALSDFVTTASITTNLNTPTFTVSGNDISWQSYSSAKYIVEYNSNCFVIDNNSYSLDFSSINSTDLDVNVYILYNGYKPFKKELTINCKTKLETPTITEHQGFKSSNPYLLTFTGSENALGYAIHIKASTATTFEPIDIIYTSTEINLYQYIVSQNKYVTYDLRIQAIADSCGRYEDSELSSVISITRSNSLAAPQFAPEAVTKSTTGGKVSYYLNFFGVENANSYEILINYNKQSIVSKSPDYTGLYKVEITDYLSAANNYDIKIRSIPSSSDQNTIPSTYRTTSFALTKQLQQVPEIKVAEKDGVYTLSFTTVENAISYRVRIVKVADSKYYDYLRAENIPYPFTINQSVDITKYLKGQGEYHIYLTALAAEDSYYGDANESSNYAVVSKLYTLTKPHNLTTENKDKSTYLLKWEGDINTDYYLVKLTDTYGFEHEFNVYGSASANISSYLTVPGNYSAEVSAMINPLSSNAAEYESSSSTRFDITYNLTNPHDFERHAISMYGYSTDYVVDSFEDLKTLLWHHYLYKLDDFGLSIYINNQPCEEIIDGTPVIRTETVKESIVRLADEASVLHNFNTDSEWLNKKASESDSNLLKYLCSVILENYPELNILEDMSVSHEDGSNKFILRYKNALNTDKEFDETYGGITEIESINQLTTENYANKFTYLGKNIRKNINSRFAIDSRPEKLVETTEQLVQAIEYGYKPKFFGNSETAEKVYLNAKQVLVAIIYDNMDSTLKTTRIFDWISYAYNLNLYADKTSSANVVVDADLSTYGIRADFYLEGMLLNLSTNKSISNPKAYDGEFDLTNMYATNSSYTKLFSLLCGIEGIQTITEYGTLEEKAYNWNRINLNGTWYNVDITASDNKLSTSTYGISMASHSHFLVSDNFMKKYNSSLEFSNTTINCNQTYNYYQNNNFTISKEAFLSMKLPTNNFQLSSDVNLSKQYDPTESYESFGVPGYTQMQAMLINLMLYAKENVQNGRCSFEFSFRRIDNAGDMTANGIIGQTNIITLAMNALPGYFNFKLDLKTRNVYIDDENGAEDEFDRTIVMVAFDII